MYTRLFSESNQQLRRSVVGFSLWNPKSFQALSIIAGFSLSGKAVLYSSSNSSSLEESTFRFDSSTMPCNCWY